MFLTAMEHDAEASMPHAWSGSGPGPSAPTLGSRKCPEFVGHIVFG